MKTIISMGKEIKIFSFLFLLNAFILNAQYEECATIITEFPSFEAEWALENQSSFSPASITNTPYVIKVHFWQVNDGNGNAANPLTESQVLDAIARLNRDYNSYNIFFKFDGMTEFDSEDFYELIVIPGDSGDPLDQGDEFNQFQKDNNYYFGGTINYYSVNHIQNAEAYYKNNGEGIFGTIVSRYYNIGDSPIMSHEVGHFFSLRHTFHIDATNTIPPIIYKENVTRNDDGCFNADFRGDRVVDTNATPVSMAIDPITCSYIPMGETDDCGIAYNAYGLEPEVYNFMSYSTCREEFTIGQAIKMRNFIEFIENSSTLNFIETHSPAILYEPYKGSYYFAGPITEEHHPLFQYGFTYKFVDVSQAEVWNQPSPYEYTNFWTGQGVGSYPYSYNQPIEHNNHTAFYIAELGDFIYRKCYNNYNRTPNGGNIINFLDGYPNANYTITPQDSTAINNPALINNLTPGLYNIQKSYDDGTTQEVMILKENN